MKDWRAAVRTWEQRQADERKGKPGTIRKAHNHHQRTYTDADFEKIGINLD